MSEIEITTRTYDHIATEFAERWWNVHLDQAIDSFASRLKPGATVLDLGCGPGRDIALLRRRGYDVIGMDLSQGMLREAQQRVGGLLAGADMRRLPLPDASLNGVWLCAALLHLPRADALPTLQEIWRVLRDDGVLYVSVQRGEGERWAYSEGGRRFFTYYRLEEMRGLAVQAGYSVPEIWLNALIDRSWIHLIARK
jgi:SAM-dependent methyltransferase